MWGATNNLPWYTSNSVYFNPRSPCGERRYRISLRHLCRNFNPRSPCGERLLMGKGFINAFDISIHAPRVGSDLTVCNLQAPGHHFNPRSPCVERPALHPTPAKRCGDFNPRSPYGERPPLRIYWRHLCPFQSTLPLWGATIGGSKDDFVIVISIHAPRVGRDHYAISCISVFPHFNPRSPCGERLSRPSAHRAGKHFNPRSPCGERLPAQPQQPAQKPFQSTLPVWGATIYGNGAALRGAISIHAPRVGSDIKSVSITPNPVISIHAPRVGSDCNFCTIRYAVNISIHAPRVGSDSGQLLCFPRQKYFNPRSPCGERHQNRQNTVICFVLNL